jgi:hypothetical protein
MRRDDWDRYERIAHEPNVKLAMRARCEEQGHEWEGCCTAMFQIYQGCKWCGERR